VPLVLALALAVPAAAAMALPHSKPVKAVTKAKVRRRFVSIQFHPGR
jgi:hypothetical protein